MCLDMASSCGTCPTYLGTPRLRNPKYPPRVLYLPTWVPRYLGKYLPLG